MNMVLPNPEFLPGLRAICDQYGAVLIFDEVMTGFRVAPGGVQEVYGVTPDLTTFGKVIGAGMPVGVPFAAVGIKTALEVFNIQAAIATCLSCDKIFCNWKKRKNVAPINAASICVNVFARRAPNIRTNVIVSSNPIAAVVSPSAAMTG